MTTPDDQYTTISEKQTGEGRYSEKRSKFLAFAHHVESAEDALRLAAQYKKKYFDARHVCWAYMIGAERDIFRSNDDGEPSGTAGRPILGQINSHGLTNIFIAVVRYFGGVKLGTSGLIVAYRTAAADAIGHALVETRIVEEVITCSFPYAATNDVMRLVKEMHLRIINQHFDNTCHITLAIRRSLAPELRHRLDNLCENRCNTVET